MFISGRVFLKKHNHEKKRKNTRIKQTEPNGRGPNWGGGEICNDNWVQSHEEWNGELNRDKKKKKKKEGNNAKEEVRRKSSTDQKEWKKKT
jgi:hypothetical protein